MRLTAAKRSFEIRHHELHRRHHQGAPCCRARRLQLRRDPAGSTAPSRCSIVGLPPGFVYG